MLRTSLSLREYDAGALRNQIPSGARIRARQPRAAGRSPSLARFGCRRAPPRPRRARACRRPPARASAPIGVWQPPPSASTSARSASSATLASASSIRLTICRTASSFGANFDGDDALSGRRHARARRQRHRNARRHPEPPESRGRQHQRVVVAGVELSEARVQVAANGREPRALQHARRAARCGARCPCRCSATGRARATRSVKS